MKKLLGILMLSIVMPILTGCGSDLNPYEDGHHRVKIENNRPVLKTVRMVLGGDYVSETEEPLLRADEGDTYVGINVFRTEKDKEGAIEEKYAYGVFKNKEDINIDLLTGYTYRFQATMLVEREHKLFVNEGRLREPFRIKDAESSDNSSFEKNDMDKFHYTDNIASDSKRIYLMELNSGVANVNAGEDYGAQYGSLWYPRVKRFYGELPSFDPSLLDVVNIDLAYKCFGLKILLSSLPSGTVTVTDITKLDALRDKAENQKLVFPKGLELSNEGVSEWEGVYSLHSLMGDSETFNLRFTWNKGGSAKEVFETSVTVQPKIRKVLKLNITGTPNYVTKGNITLTLENEDLTDEEEVVNGNFD